MTNIAQRSFAKGELAPTLHARTDQAAYATGLATCRNFIVLKEGGVTNRPGTEFSTQVDARVRMIPFVYDDDQTYVLVFGAGYIEFIKDGAPLTFGTSDLWVNAHDYTAGQISYINLPFTFYTCKLAHHSATATNKPGTGSDWETYWYPLTDHTYKIANPYTVDELFELSYDQTADTVTIVHSSHPAMRLSRISETEWSFLPISFVPSETAPTSFAVSGGAGAVEYYKGTALAATTYEESLPTAAVGTSAVATPGAPRTLSWVAPTTGAVEYNVYKSTTGINGPYGFIGVSTGLTFVDNGVIPDTLFTPPIANNPFSGSGNYPGAAGSFQQREIYGGTTNKPWGYAMSRSANLDNFTISSPIQDDDAIIGSLVAKKVPRILAIMDVGVLVMFTTEGEWVFTGDVSGILRPLSCAPGHISENGSKLPAPVKVDTNVLYIQSRGKVIRELSLDPRVIGRDVTIYSSHLFRNYGITDWAYQQNPNSIVWVVRDDGTLLGLTDLKEQDVLGWHRHETDGAVESVCVIPENGEDALYLCVRRNLPGPTAAGTNVWYIERMVQRDFTDINDAVFIDCESNYNGFNPTFDYTSSAPAISDTFTNQPIPPPLNGYFYTGITTTMELSYAALNNDLIVEADGVVVNPADYTLSGDFFTITFNSPISATVNVTADYTNLKNAAIHDEILVQQYPPALEDGHFFGGITTILMASNVPDPGSFAIEFDGVPVPGGDFVLTGLRVDFDDPIPDTVQQVTFSFTQVTAGTTMTLSGGTNWTYDEHLTVTSSVSTFAEGIEGTGLTLSDGDDTVEFLIDERDSYTVVKGHVNKTVPAGLRSIATIDWTAAINLMYGLGRLEGKAVSVFADGAVVASPNNPAYEVLTVTAGTLQLPHNYSYIRVGLPYTSDLKTLAIDTPSGPSLKGKAMLITEVLVSVLESRGGFVGQTEPDDDGTTNMMEWQIRNVDDGYDVVPFDTDTVKVLFPGDWNKDGSLLIRQVDPLPLTILAVAPSGLIPPANP